MIQSTVNTLFVCLDSFSHLMLPAHYRCCLYLRLPVVSLRVPFKALRIYADGGAHPSTVATHSKHEARCIIEDDP